MDAMTTDFGEVLLWSFWFFIWIAAFTFWFRCILDLFGDDSLRGWAKAGWAIFLIFVPWVGALIYLIARGTSITARQRASRERPPQEEYLGPIASSPTRTADQIAGAKALLDSGAITQAEFDQLKAKALS
jgi:hypothetical protein